MKNIHNVNSEKEIILVGDGISSLRRNWVWLAFHFLSLVQRSLLWRLA